MSARSKEFQRRFQQRQQEAQAVTDERREQLLREAEAIYNRSQAQRRSRHERLLIRHTRAPISITPMLGSEGLPPEVVERLEEALAATEERRRQQEIREQRRAQREARAAQRRRNEEERAAQRDTTSTFVAGRKLDIE